MEEGAVTEDYGAQRHQVVRLFNDVLATEVVCVLRYKRHFFMAKGMNAESVNEEFVKHANEEQQHAEWVVERITQLNGEPDFNPQRLTSRSESEYKKGDDLVSVIKQDVVAERIAVESYTAIVRWLGEGGPVAPRLIVDILKVEEEHADDMANLLDSTSGK
jgi:bacterioferritin